MLQIAIVEDEQEYVDQISAFVRQYAHEHAVALDFTIFRDGSEILQDYQTAVFDIILLDIEMPCMTGMEAAEEIRKRDEDVVLVFITNMAQYAIRGYSVGALDFILKPVTYYTFSLRLARAIARAKSRESGQVLLPTQDGVKRLETKQIYYVEVQSRMLHYYTQQGEFVLRGTMQAAEKELAPYHFVRCNYWYLVNLHHVSEVKKDMAVVGNIELEISRRNKAAFLAALTGYLGGRI